MTDEQAQLRDLLRAWVGAERELQKCLDTTEYEAGYFCYRHTEHRDETGVAFFAAFDAYIDQRITTLTGAC